MATYIFQYQSARFHFIACGHLTSFVYKIPIQNIESSMLKRLDACIKVDGDLKSNLIFSIIVVLIVSNILFAAFCLNSTGK